MTCDIPGIDGKQQVHKYAADNCCPPNICNIDWCRFICNFIQMLPSGPMWDRPKAERISWYSNRSNITCVTGECKPSSCVTLVDHAVYSAKNLLNVLFDALWPAIRESDPITAYDTLDDWLVRLGWRNCFDCACKDPDIKNSPFECLGMIDNCEVSQCFELKIPDDLECAVKFGIVRALTRLSLGIIRNLDSINFVLEPLSAKLEPVTSREILLDPVRCDADDGTTSPAECPDLAMTQFDFRVVPIGDTIRKCQKTECPQITDELPKDVCGVDQFATVQSFFEPCLIDNPLVVAGRRIYPATLAAECIVRSMLPRGSRIKIIAGC